jgi:predicted ATP-dependent endonuclease of OLD family
MIPSSIRVKVEGFRAVNEADIIINGITVVAGENGCGKSSISKLLYFLYKTVSNYDLLVKKNLILNLRDVIKFIDILQQELRLDVKDRNIRDEFRREISDLKKNLYGSDYLSDELSKWLILVDKLEGLFNLINAPINSNIKQSSVRLKYILKDILKDEDPGNDLVDSLKQIKIFIEDKFNKAIGFINSRPTLLFIEELKSVFSDGDLPKKFQVLEYDDLIVSLEMNYLSIPYNIQNAIYIDTPMMISVENSHNEHWNDLNELLLKKGNKQSIFTQIISNEITNGDIIIGEGIYSTDDFKFKRSDGEVFNLLDIATGIKSFLILQQLLKNGSISDKTLLIIDEPESNLHPQWIIEYARIIVLLNKQLGVKFFLATHNPDMVSAIRYISEKEGNLDNVIFYLALPSDKEFSYKYHLLDKNIEPIFGSFNIAIDRINKYGV